MKKLTISIIKTKNSYSNDAYLFNMLLERTGRDGEGWHDSMIEVDSIEIKEIIKL